MFLLVMLHLLRVMLRMLLLNSWGILSKYVSGPKRKAHEAENAVHSLLIILTDNQNTAGNVPIVDNNIVIRDASWDLCGLKSKQDHGCSILQGIQAPYNNSSLAGL